MSFLIHSLITWRLTSMLTYRDAARPGEQFAERGPFAIFDRFRTAIGVAYDDLGNCKPTNEIAAMVCCIWCLSIWVGLAVAILSGKRPQYALALSAAALLIERVVRRDLNVAINLTIGE